MSSKTTTLGENIIQGNCFNISGGSIDGVSIGVDTPASFFKVGSLTFSKNTIRATNVNGINFSNNDIIAGSFTFSTASNLDFTAGNLIDAGDVKLDSINAQTGSGIDINLKNNQASALVVRQGVNEYLRFDTVNSKIVVSQNLELDANISGLNFTITGGNIDNTIIGANTAVSVNFTNLSFDSQVGASDFK
ncbi:hypothetical protein [Abyssogena phaseoliformis symbiont]|uniref:hypothetical protein n=1 Tax=Abyssogena phaseoliformis symbiont TaxID=596095 RepID=UPI00191580AA|nr:hypothetical protein [Abyssogena phaseoliformis symbiont]